MAYAQHHHFGGPQQFSPQPGYGPPPPGSQFQQAPYPPPQHGYPPQGQFPPPHGQFPPPHGYHYGALPPPAGPYGQPMPQPYYGVQGPHPGNVVSAPPSPGYDLNAPLPQGGAGARRDAEVLYAAMKGFGTNEKQLIRILSKPNPDQMRALVHAFNSLPKKDRKTLEQWVVSETSGNFREGLTALVRGPLHQDVYLLYTGMKGLGTKESFLNDVLCCRSNADIRAIKTLYKQTYHKDLVAAVKDDLSFKTETMFEMILAANRAEETMPYDPAALDRDAEQLRNAMYGVGTTDQLSVCSVLTSRSNNQLRGIAQIYPQKLRKPMSLAESIGEKFSGHMKDALLLILRRATDPAMCAAEELNAVMSTIGRGNELLVQRVVRCHWDRVAMDQVKRAYKHRYGKDLITQVGNAAGGDTGRLVVACLE